MSIDLKTPFWLLLFFTTVYTLSGCDDGGVRWPADGRTLCDPATQEAFVVTPYRPGTPRVARAPHQDSLCRPKPGKLTRLVSN